MGGAAIRSPVSATRGLIFANLIVFAMTMMTPGGDGGLAAKYGANPQSFHWWQLFTSQFLHAGMLHLGMNMFGLAIFGPPVEGRLGGARFVALYLLCGVAGGAAHVLTAPVPAIGASGGVMGIVGAFAILFPRARIGLIMVPRPIPAPVLAGVYLLIDLLGTRGAPDGVAHWAHIAGMACGVALPTIALALGWLPTNGADAVFLLLRKVRGGHHRRTPPRATRRRGPAPAAAPGSAAAPQGAPGSAAPEHAPDAAALRAAVLALHSTRQLGRATEAYLRLLRQDPRATMPDGVQLELANELWERGDADSAVTAWELHRAAYPGGPRVDEIDLLLALAYARRLGRPERAREILGRLVPRLQGGPLAPAAAALATELGA